MTVPLMIWSAITVTDSQACRAERSIEVITAPNDFAVVKDALVAAGLKPAFAELTMKPSTEVELAGEDAQRMQKLLDALEAIDDVQEVHTSAVMEG